MEKRELFVFAGQSNMMGACVYPVKKQIVYQRSYEYLHNPKRLGAKSGVFKSIAFPVGEFSYKDLEKAYSENLTENGKSKLGDYHENTYFCPAMCNLKSEEEKTVFNFSYFNETNLPLAPSLAAFVVEGWEQRGRQCAFAHIAQGGVGIRYFFNEKMADDVNKRIVEYNKRNSMALTTIGDACANEVHAYFCEKVKAFFEDSEKKFAHEDLTDKCFFWLQGESDSDMPKDLYKIYLSVLWEELKKLGFTHFFCIRTGFWMNDNIVNIMEAQEEFCKENADVYMVTRVCSYMPMPIQDIAKWYEKKEIEKYFGCRDSYFGFDNQHINEKGFKIISKAVCKNIYKILIEKSFPHCEDEKCILLK